MANTGAIWQHAAHNQPIYHLLAAKRDPYQKLYLLMNNNDEFSGAKV